jgi:hypothetical protein
MSSEGQTFVYRREGWEPPRRKNPAKLFQLTGLQAEKPEVLPVESVAVPVTT